MNTPPTALSGASVESAAASGISRKRRAVVGRTLFTVSPADRSDAPIYAELVEERGDVPAEARRTAEQTQRMLEQAVDFGRRSYGRG